MYSKHNSEYGDDNPSFTSSQCIVSSADPSTPSQPETRDWTLLVADKSRRFAMRTIAHVTIRTLLALPLIRLSTTSAQTSTPFTHPLLTSPSNTPQSTSYAQHFIHPAKNDILAPNTTFSILWTAIPAFTTVTIQLWDRAFHGYSHDFLSSPCRPYRSSFCGTIASHVPNTGSFIWKIPPIPVNKTNTRHGFPTGEQVFWLKMWVEDYVKDSMGNREPVVTYSQHFGFAKEGKSGTLVSVDLSSLTGMEGLPLETVALTSLGEGEGGVRTSVSASAARVTGTERSIATGGVATRIPVGSATGIAIVKGRAGRMRGGLVGWLLRSLGLVRWF